MYPLVLFTEKNTPSVPRCPINLPPFNFEFMLDACGTLVLRLQSCTSLTFGSEITKISEISATAERPVRRCSNLVHCHIRYPSVVKLGCARSGGKKKLASLGDPTKYGGPWKSDHQTLLGQARCTLQGQVRLQEHEKGTELLKCGEIFGKRHPHTRREGWQGNTCWKCEVHNTSSFKCDIFYLLNLPSLIHSSGHRQKRGKEKACSRCSAAINTEL